MENLQALANRIIWYFLLLSSLFSWSQNNQPPTLVAVGRQAFCPGESIPIATQFTITDPDDSELDAFYVQISSGYQLGFDRLQLTGSHPTILTSWDVTEGKLALFSSTSGGKITLETIEQAVLDVVFTTTASNITSEKTFSFTLGDANFLPSTGHYYEFVQDDFIDWQSAKNAAENRTYFGLKGYLATLLSEEEAQFCGEQAAGTGWIGASDADQEGVWKWVTGPDAGTVFWNGASNGSTPAGSFAFWNTGEPNNAGNEDYAHITDDQIGIPGSWNDLALAGGTGVYAPRGYIVEYGGMAGDPELTISASTSIYIPEIISTTEGQSCIGQEITLAASSSEGEVYWYDSLIGGSPLSVGNQFTTPTLNETTTFYASAAPENCSNNTRVAVVATVFPNPQVESEVLLERCDDDQDGFARFDLTEANGMLSTNADSETFSYYPSENDAQNDTNAIPLATNYQNQIRTKDTVWVRTTNATNCFMVSKIVLRVQSTTIPDSFEKIYEVCDDFTDADASDDDGISSFNFSEVTYEIRNFFPGEQQDFLSISHYPTRTDAENETNEIINLSNYRNTTPNTQQIFTRVRHSENDTCDYIGSHITLNVLPTPQVFIEEWNLCDDATDGDDTNGILQNINLEDITLQLLGNQDPSSFNVSYHETPADAASGTSPISSPFTNTTAHSQILFLRLENKETGCISTTHALQLNIRPLPVIRDQVELKQCDTDTDGFVSFNLHEVGFDISDNYQNETFAFYESLSDAKNGINPIENSTTYINKAPTKDKVWARAISEYGCYRIAEVNLTVSTTGVPPTFQRSFTACDDLIDGDDTDGISSFDFSSVTNEIKDLFPSNQELIIVYYRNLEDALAEQNAIEDPSNYRNIGYPHTQEIFIRVDSELDNDCLGLGHHITLEVEAVPVANPLEDIEICDDLLSGSAFDGQNVEIDLRAKVSDILGPNRSLDDFKVSFHTSQEGATDGVSDVIANDSNYTNTTAPDFLPGTINEQTIYVRVESLSGQTCYNANTSFKIVIHPLPVVPPSLSDFAVCETVTERDSDPRNRIAQNINLRLIEEEILAGREGYVVRYFNSQQDAETKQNPILNPENYENLSTETVFPSNMSSDEPAIQTIYYTVTDLNGLQCTSLVSHFDLVIHPEPRVDPIPRYDLCDDAMDGDDTNGLIQNIDFNMLIPMIIGSDRNTDDYQVTFHRTQEDADFGLSSISFPYENSSATETIYIRVENKYTGCVAANASFLMVINPLPEIRLNSPQILCLNDLPYVITPENTSDDYRYEWFSTDGESIGTNDNLEIVDQGTYTLTATDIITGCSRTEVVIVNESNVADLKSDFITIIDESLTTHTPDVFSIFIDTKNNNLGPGDYQFAVRNTETNERIPFSGFQDEPRFEVDQGGIYEIIINDRNGCLPDAILEVSVVQFPKFFTPNADGINDFWLVRGTTQVFYPSSSMQIFNRFGKLLYQFEAGDQGWDGTLNGTPLPADDYWYHIILIPSDQTKPTIQKKGNFSLLR